MYFPNRACRTSDITDLTDTLGCFNNGSAYALFGTKMKHFYRRHGTMSCNGYYNQPKTSYYTNRTQPKFCYSIDTNVSILCNSYMFVFISQLKALYNYHVIITSIEYYGVTLP